MTDLVPPPASSGKSLMERVEDALLPLINLVFLLLMFFIVAGQLADTPLPDLPSAARSDLSQSPEADLLVSEDVSMADLETLLQALEDIGFTEVLLLTEPSQS